VGGDTYSSSFVRSDGLGGGGAGVMVKPVVGVMVGEAGPGALVVNPVYVLTCGDLTVGGVLPLPR